MESPRFLADESCDFSVVRALRAEGYDVAAVIERLPGAADNRVIDLARSESRILITEDRDFGRLVFAALHATNGIVYIRFPAQRRAELAARVVELARSHGSRLSGVFAVITPDRIRLAALPG